MTVKSSISLTDQHHAFARALVAHRRAGAFLTADQMQDRLAAMLAQKRRA